MASVHLAIVDIENEWKNFIMEGTNVKPLAPVTLASKIAKGSIYPDIPLVDTEEMIKSIGTEVESIGENSVRGIVYGTDEKWIYHEYGLGVPERSTLRPVWDTEIDKKIDQIFDDVFENTKSIFSK